MKLVIPPISNKTMAQKIKSKQVILSVSDMHCPSCPKLITLGLKDQKGVTSVAASLENKQVVVDFDPSKIKITDLVANVKESGYTAVPQEDGSVNIVSNGHSELPKAIIAES